MLDIKFIVESFLHLFACMTLVSCAVSGCVIWLGEAESIRNSIIINVCLVVITLVLVIMNGRIV